MFGGFCPKGFCLWGLFRGILSQDGFVLHPYYTINWNTAVSKNLAGAHVPDSGPFAGMKLGYHNTIDGLPSKWGADTTVRRFCYASKKRYS